MVSKVIGLDPGVNTGIAIAINGKLSDLITTDFWGLIDIIEQNKGALFVVEKPKNNHVHHNGAKTKATIQGTARRVGSVLRETQLVISYLDRNGCRYITQSPLKKREADEFKRITGWVGRTNQHMRDSAMMIHGLTINNQLIEI